MKSSLRTGVRRLAMLGLALFLGLSSAHGATKRVAILYSDTARQNFFDEFSYYQLFMAMQYQCTMAGIPYDLVDEDDLTNAANLVNYDVLLAPQFEFVPSSKRPQILAALTQATASGLNIVASGWFLAFDQSGVEYPDFIDTLDTMVGVQAVTFYSAVTADVVANDVTHPAMPGYTPNQVISSYNQIWSTTWQPGTGANPAASTTLCSYNIGGVIEPAVLAITTTDGRRNVHFANEQIMQDANLLWSALQWSLYGDATPIALRIGRERSIFFARNDMDQSQFAEEVPLVHVPLLDIITEWEEQHDFAGSFYLNVGNNQSQGEFTNWSFSGPLYQQYRALGNEIGTHSYTHPDNTASLNATQLEFQFNQSVLAIEQGMGIDVPGAAVPGLPESPFVIKTVEPWLEYLSGRSAIADTSFGLTSAFGRIRPGFDMFYFCLNTSPDFTLIDFLGIPPAQAAQIWQQEYAQLHTNAPFPVVHWLWHDYGPTGFEPGYVRAPFDTMVATAAAGGSEFVTGDDLYRRVDALQAANLDVTAIDADSHAVTVGSSDAGRLSLMLPEGAVISRVDNWYAYDGNKVFLPKNGGTFTIHTEGAPVPATRITKMPPRSELLTLSGNGSTLNFTFAGKGALTLELNESGLPLQVDGADSIVKNGNRLTLQFDSIGPHQVSVFESLGNQPPEANSFFITTRQGTSVAFILDASDPEGNPLQYTVGSPASGTLQGSAPNLTYIPNPGFSGQDQVTYTVSDGIASSGPATVFIVVTETAVEVDGNLADWASITPLVNDPADTPDTVDILQLYALLDEGTLYLAMNNEGPIGQLNYGYTWYLDVDKDSTTGFEMFSIGADFVIEGATLYSFAGATQSTWQWNFVAETVHAIQGSSAELSLDAALLGNADSFDLLFWGNNDAFGTTSIDIAPDAGFARFNGAPSAGNPIAINGDFADWPANPYTLVDGNDLPGVNAVDILQVQMTAQDNNLYIGYTNESPLPALGWTYTLYLDTDLNPATGFQSGNLGADYMIQDAALYAYAGTGPDWIWTAAANLLVALNADKIEIEVPLAGFGSPSILAFEVVGENAALGAPGGTDFAVGQVDLGLTQNLSSPFPRRALRPIAEPVLGSKEAIGPGLPGVDGHNVRLPFARQLIEESLRSNKR